MTQLIAPPRGLSRSRHISSGLASLALGLVLVVGVPLLLWQFVGWPLPHTVHAPSSIVDALGRSNVPDAVIVKALALGAKAVGIGRPYAYGAALAGTDGIVHVLRSLLAEADLIMAIDGYPTLADLTPDALRRVRQ